MTERTKELRSILIQLLIGLGMTKPRIMLTMAIISAYQIEYEMAYWAVDYYKKNGLLTVKIFMSKLNELTDDIDSY